MRGAALTEDHAALSAMVLAHGQTKLTPALRTVRCLLVADPPRLTRRIGLGALFERSDTGIADAHGGIPAEMWQRRQILAARRAHGMTAGMAIEKLPLFLFADGAHWRSDHFDWVKREERGRFAARRMLAPHMEAVKADALVFHKSEVFEADGKIGALLAENPPTRATVMLALERGKRSAAASALTHFAVAFPYHRNELVLKGWRDRDLPLLQSRGICPLFGRWSGVAAQR